MLRIWPHCPRLLLPASCCLGAGWGRARAIIRPCYEQQKTCKLHGRERRKRATGCSLVYFKAAILPGQGKSGGFGWPSGKQNTRTRTHTQTHTHLLPPSSRASPASSPPLPLPRATLRHMPPRTTCQPQAITLHPGTKQSQHSQERQGFRRTTPHTAKKCVSVRMCRRSG